MEVCKTTTPSFGLKVKYLQLKEKKNVLHFTSCIKNNLCRAGGKKFYVEIEWMKILYFTEMDEESSW